MSTTTYGAKGGGVVVTYSSAFTGHDCVAAIPFRTSENDKTGPMAQLSFLTLREEPHVAQRTGADRDVCLDCRNCPRLGGCCYVLTCNAPLASYRAIKRGRYGAPLPLDRPLRIGAYGDPASMPPAAWWSLLDFLRPTRWTGYTHQWRSALHLRQYCMASVDTVREAKAAKRLGWRTFRIRRPGTALLSGEIYCPALASGHKVKCISCGLCNGTTGAGRPSIVADAHGARAGRFA